MPGSERLLVGRWDEHGPSVVLLHGIGGSSRYWFGVAGASGEYRASAPDLLWFGRSPRPEGTTYNVNHLAQSEPLAPPGSVVVAHSTGAVLAAAMAVRRPDLASSLLSSVIQCPSNGDSNVRPSPDMPPAQAAARPSLRHSLASTSTPVTGLSAACVAR